MSFDAVWRTLAGKSSSISDIDATQNERLARLEGKMNLVGLLTTGILAIELAHFIFGV